MPPGLYISSHFVFLNVIGLFFSLRQRWGDTLGLAVEFYIFPCELSKEIYPFCIDHSPNSHKWAPPGLLSSVQV